MKIPRPLLLLFQVALALFCGGCVVILNLYTDHDSAGPTGPGGVGGSGGGGACAPGAIVDCYDGPAGTEGVGLCKPGAKTCAADGASFGPCKGAILPVAENCATPVDEDCDGLAPPCKGALLWAKRFGDASEQLGASVAVDSAGNVLVTGRISGKVDFGAGPLVAAGTDVFVAKLDASGNYLWSKIFGDAGTQYGTSITVDGAGNVLVTGAFSGTVDFGGGPLVSKGAQDVFVAKLDASGNHVWSKRFGDAADQISYGIAVDGKGNVLVTGAFSGSIDFGGGALNCGGFYDVFVAKLDASGNHVWSKTFGETGILSGISVAADSAGNVLVIGHVSGSIDFGGGPLVAAGTDAFVAKLDASGNHVWSKLFGDAADQHGQGIAADGAGNVLVTGAFSGSIDFGGGPLVSKGAQDVFVAKLNASGNHVWSKRFGDAADQFSNGIAVDGKGNVLVTGAFSGSIDFGDGQYVTAGKEDVFVAKLDAVKGNHLWSKRFGDAADQIGYGIAVDSANNVLVTGAFSGSADFGGVSLVSDGGEDIFVAKFGE
jgi:hypothetical protein